MYIIRYDGLESEFNNRLEKYREAVKNFPKTVGVPAPSEIFPILKIVNDNLSEDDYTLIANKEIEDKE